LKGFAMQTLILLALAAAASAVVEELLED